MMEIFIFLLLLVIALLYDRWLVWILNRRFVRRVKVHSTGVFDGYTGTAYFNPIDDYILVKLDGINISVPFTDREIKFIEK